MNITEITCIADSHKFNPYPNLKPIGSYGGNMTCVKDGVLCGHDACIIWQSYEDYTVDKDNPRPGVSVTIDGVTHHCPLTVIAALVEKRIERFAHNADRIKRKLEIAQAQHNAQGD